MSPMSPRPNRQRSVRLVAYAALLAIHVLGLFGCSTWIGRTGDESPLTGVTKNLLPAYFEPAWRRVLNEGPIYDTIPHERAGAAYSERHRLVCVGSRAGWFECLQAGNGQRVWRKPFPGGISGHAIFDGDRILVGTDNGRLLALDARTGEIEWHYDVPGAVIRRPVLHRNRIFFVDGTNSIYALDRATGEWKWQYRRTRPAEFALVGESNVRVVDDRIYAGFSDGFVVCLESDDGAVTWVRDIAPEHERFQDVDATPVIIDDTLYVASAASGFFALAPDTGEVRWSMPVSGIVAMTDHDGDLIASTDRGTLMRISGRDGRRRWRTKLRGGAPGTPVTASGLVIVGVSRGALHFVDPGTGRPIQQFAPGPGVSATATVGRDGRIFIVSNGGVIYALRPIGRRPT